MTHEPKVKTMQRVKNLFLTCYFPRIAADTSAPKAPTPAASDHYASSQATSASPVTRSHGLPLSRLGGAVASHEAGCKIMAQQNAPEIRAWLDANPAAADRLATFFRLVTHPSLPDAQRLSAARIVCDALSAPELKAMLDADPPVSLLLRAVFSMRSQEATCDAIRRVPGHWEKLGLHVPVLGPSANH